MSEAYPAITFTVSIQPDPNGALLSPPAERAALAMTRSVFIPGLSGGDILVGFNGDTFTLYGKYALYYKMMIDTGKIVDLTYDLPAVRSEVSDLSYTGAIDTLFLNGISINEAFPQD